MAKTIYGNDYNDTIYQSDYSSGPVNIYSYDGNDKIYLDVTSYNGGENYVSAGYGNDYVKNSFEGGNVVYLGNDADTYFAAIKAGDSNQYDKVYAGSGNDVIDVDSKASVYYGESGNDTFYSVGYNNTFNGGNGTDTISYENQDDYSSQRGKGVTIDLAAETASTASGRLEDLISIENATGTNSGSDDIFGTDARNILKGLGGNDVLKGYGGEDDLYGGSGADDLYGGAKNDILVGGSGRDFLSGGSGADTFDFNSINDSVVGTNRDVIDDFRHSEYDVVDLQSIDANANRGGNQAFSFIGGNGFHEKAGELRFSGGILSGDVDGDGYADFQIKMNGVTKMVAGDGGDFFL